MIRVKCVDWVINFLFLFFVHLVIHSLNFNNLKNKEADCCYSSIIQEICVLSNLVVFSLLHFIRSILAIYVSVSRELRLYVNN